MENLAAELLAIGDYCRKHRQSFWVIHTPPSSKIGGFSCKLLGIDTDSNVAYIEIANGDTEYVPIEEIYWR